MDNNQQNPNPHEISPHSGGFFRDLTDRFRLISRLMTDGRVNPLLKILPIGTLVYAIWPIDFPTPVDDVFVIWLGTTLFVQLCPPEVVDEHTRALQSGASGVKWQDISSGAQSGDVIDGEYFEGEPEKRHQTPSR
jgi:hypothetical protein